jgi:hypothetical protein
MSTQTETREERAIAAIVRLEAEGYVITAPGGACITIRRQHDHPACIRYISLKGLTEAEDPYTHILETMKGRW